MGSHLAMPAKSGNCVRHQTVFSAEALFDPTQSFSMRTLLATNTGWRILPRPGASRMLPVFFEPLEGAVHIERLSPGQGRQGVNRIRVVTPDSLKQGHFFRGE